MNKALAYALIGLAAAAAPASATDGYYFNGYGIQGEGLGGASIAYPKDSLAIASNPASALFLGGRFDAGAEWFRPDRSATIQGNAGPLNGDYDGNARQDYLIPQIGYVTQYTPNIAFGIAAYGNGLGSNYKRDPFTGQGGPAGMTFEQFFLSPTAAYQFAPGHSLGVSVNLGYQRLNVKGLQSFEAFSINPGGLSNNGTDDAFGIGARVGYLGHITPEFSLGVTYTSETNFQKFASYNGLLADRGGFNAPQNAGVGVAYKFTPQLDLTAEYEFIDYSSIDSVGNAGLAKLLAGQKLGSNGGPGFNWQDANVFRIGANYQYNSQLQLRAGYAYTTQVIRDTETLLNIVAPATVQNQFTAGFTWETPSHRWEYSGYLLYAPEDKVDGHNSIPAAFGGGEADIKLSEFSIGFAVGYKFDQPVPSLKDGPSLKE